MENPLMNCFNDYARSSENKWQSFISFPSDLSPTTTDKLSPWAIWPGWLVLRALTLELKWRRRQQQQRPCNLIFLHYYYRRHQNSNSNNDGHDSQLLNPSRFFPLLHLNEKGNPKFISEQSKGVSSIKDDPQSHSIKSRAALAAFVWRLNGSMCHKWDR